MRKILCIFSMSMLVLSCSFNYFDERVITELDVYEDNKKNEALGKDLLFYKYNLFLLDEVRGLKKEDLPYIQWRYFTDLVKKKVTFKLKLNLKNESIKANADELEAYFKKKVKKQIEYHLKYEDEFKEAGEVALNYLELLDEGLVDEFWKLCDSDITASMTYEQFSDLVEKLKSSFERGEQREFHSKQFYDRYQNTVAGKYFQFNYFSKSHKKQLYETIILEKNEGKWLVIGFHFNIR